MKIVRSSFILLLAIYYFFVYVSFRTEEKTGRKRPRRKNATIKDKTKERIAKNKKRKNEYRNKKHKAKLKIAEDNKKETARTRQEQKKMTEKHKMCK